MAQVASLWKAKTHLSCIFNTIVADDLEPQGARSSVHHGFDLVIPEYSGFNHQELI